MKKALIFGLAAICGYITASYAPPSQPPPDVARQDKRVAVIRNLDRDDHTVQFLQGATEAGEVAGFAVHTFISGGSDEKTVELLDNAINRGYDGIILSHGKQDYSYDLLKKASDKGIELVTFDTVVSGEIEGLTQTGQNDKQLAELSLNELIDGMEKPTKLVKIWYSGGMLPFDTRNAVYEQMKADGLIETAGEIDLAELTDVQGDVQSALAALLKEGIEIDGIWATWDEMAKGALKALNSAGRTDIKLVSIDISDADIVLMQKHDDVWQATAAVDAKMLGKENMKLLIKKINGEETAPSVLYDGALYAVQNGKVAAK